ncbi:MAG TPA: hypothetical protein VK948_02950 [Aeromicrobium sp.]|nr:hypothetical protein [Aeromicrobium sp.]
MQDFNWIVEIYAMGDEVAQTVVAAGLSGVEGLTVEPAVSGPDRFLIVDCSSHAQAVSVRKLVTALDPSAILIHTSTASGQPVDLRVG